MNHPLRLLLSAGLGAAAMYYLDPARGRYRRALARDGLVHTGHQAQHELGVVRRDARNRALGMVARLRAMLDSRQPDDAVLEARVRACLGRVVSHPGSVQVDSENGAVKLTGPILADEVPLLLACVRRVGGVTVVRDELEVHAEPGRVPGLQGQPLRRVGQRPEFMQANWAPATRAIGAVTGAMVALYGFRRRSTAGTLVAQAGLVLLSRAVTNLEVRRLFGIGAPRHAIAVQKHIRIQAPVEKVFELWNDFERLPSFMAHVRQVRRLEAGQAGERWRWTVDGPGGMPVDFDAVVTARDENRLLAWRTEPGAPVQHAGRVQFLDDGDGWTSVDVKMVYNPIAGAVGHAVARLFGADPKHQMDDDLLRIKTFLETGKAPHDAAGRVVKLAEPQKQAASPTP